MGSSTTLAVVVLNFRTPDITIDCLRTLAPEAARNPDMRVILLDNASGDDSVPKLTEAIAQNGWNASWLEFRPLGVNLGFAGGNNLILREQMALPTPPKYLLLLNSDTLVKPGCIATCLSIMESDPKIGVLSCMLRNRDGSVQNACRKFPHPFLASIGAFGFPWLFPRLFRWADMDDEGWDRTAGPRDVDWIGGAFFLARTATLQEAGVMDEEFFFLGEDCEWCHRIWKKGWRIRPSWGSLLGRHPRAELHKECAYMESPLSRAAQVLRSLGGKSRQKYLSLHVCAAYCTSPTHTERPFGKSGLPAG